MTSDKHYAAYTSVEQSANVGPNFKLMKKDFKTMEVPHESSNPLVKIEKEKVQELEDSSNGKRVVVKLKSHNKKALLFSLANLPFATGSAYTMSNVWKRFHIQWSIGCRNY